MNARHIAMIMRLESLIVAKFFVQYKNVFLIFVHFHFLVYNEIMVCISTSHFSISKNKCMYAHCVLWENLS